jgi:hypothetical protein
MDVYKRMRLDKERTSVDKPAGKDPRFGFSFSARSVLKTIRSILYFRDVVIYDF